MKTLIPLAALAAMLSLNAGPAAAATAETALRSQTVGYADLNLASADGRAKLDRRIRLAAESVCGTASDLDLVGLNDVQQCRTRTAATALVRATAQVAGPRAVQVAAIAPN